MDAWEKLVDNSTIQSGDAWEHLCNQGGSEVIYVGYQQKTTSKIESSRTTSRNSPQRTSAKSSSVRTKSRKSTVRTRNRTNAKRTRSV